VTSPHANKLRVIHRNLAERGLLKAAALTIGARRDWKGSIHTQVSNLIHMLCEEQPRLHYGYLDHELLKEEFQFDPSVQQGDNAA